ncbi:sugar ABC transporter permease [Streptomyces sp. NBC_00882]|uniref:carbohydrate ABC transporter permease n=1 Tax=Streptomyces TaxID=1883 RepID=UPI00386BB221|nr:sugar ABC transporter permease [Streptomyces sp. NBC_00882]WSZ63393.1 sugar ABC transporter permease [Streptomyces canus]
MKTLTTPRPSAAAAPVPVTPRRRRRPARTAAVWILVGPYTAFLVVFGLAPAGYALWTSFVDNGSFTGGRDWATVFEDYRLGDAAANVATYLLLWLPILLLTVLSLAFTLHARPGRTTSALQLVYYLPGAVTGSAAALLWLFMVSPDSSPFSPLLKLMDIQSATDALSGGSVIAVLTVMGVAVHAGGWIVVLYGALNALPKDVLEAAQVDGASAWRTMWHVKLPMVRTYVAFVLISSFASGSQVFVEPTVLSTGAPGQISPTWSLNQLAYTYATQDGDFGKAAALSLAMLAVGVLAAWIVITRTRMYATDSSDSR